MVDVDQITVSGNAQQLREYADTLKDKPPPQNARKFAIPTDTEAYSEAIDNGAIKALNEAGFTICNPGTDTPALARGETGKLWPEGAQPDGSGTTA